MKRKIKTKPKLKIIKWENEKNKHDSVLKRVA